MPFIIKTGDISKIEADVIFNSVGVETTIYGGICKSIVNEAKSNELIKIFGRINNVYTVGEMFVTKGYNLPSKHIIHIVLPHFHNDKEYNQYSQCLINAFKECLKYKFKKIAIPLLGVGANKYERFTALEKIKEISNEYLKISKDSEITLLLPEKEISNNNHARLERLLLSGGVYHEDKILNKFKKGSNLFNKTFNEKKLGKISSKSLFNDKKLGLIEVGTVKTLGDYVEEYISLKVREHDDGINFTNFLDEKYFKNRLKRYLAFGSKTYSTPDEYLKNGADKYDAIKDKIDDIDKNKLYQIAFALCMSYEECKDFLNYFGYTYSSNPNNKKELILENLLKRKIYGIVEIEDRLKQNGLSSIFTIVKK